MMLGICDVKVKVALEKAIKAQRGSTLSLTSALNGVGGQRHVPAALTPGKETWYPLYMRLGRPQDRSGRVRNTSHPPGFDPRSVKTVTSRYTDRAIAVHYSVT